MASFNEKVGEEFHRGAKELGHPQNAVQVAEQDHSQQDARSNSDSQPIHPDGDEDVSTTSIRSRRRRLGRHLSWLKPQLVLKNNGSVARDHLASERTFLAYIRTSLLIASTGIALVQLLAIAANTSSSNGTVTFSPSPLQGLAKPIGISLLLISICVLIMGLVRYFTIQSALIKGNFPIARFVIAVIALTLAVFVIIIFSILASGRVRLYDISSQ